MDSSVTFDRLAALLCKVGAHEILDFDGLARCPDAVPGAYVLVIRLSRCFLVATQSAEFEFAPGWYLYSGSAWGPGGIKARLNRHFKRNKKIHWHIDHLTTASAVVAAAVFPEGDECTLVRQLTSKKGVAIGPRGFGSSDCRNCQSHLIKLAIGQQSLKRSRYCDAPETHS